MRPEDDPRHWNDLGRAASARGRHADALGCYDRALLIRSDIPQLWNNRGNALRYLDRLAEAEASLREALRLKPEFASAHNNLGNVLFYLMRWQEAEASQRTALRLEPQFALAHHNLGITLHHLGHVAEAEASYRAALRLRPEEPEWHVSLSYVLLQTGQFAEGWKEFEWRWRTKHLAAKGALFSVPFWNGEPIGNRVILLHADQGLGDTLQFCRYAPQIAAGGRVILLVQSSLTRLLSRLPGINEIGSLLEALPPFDLHCPLMSLPHALGITLETLPATGAYLTADPTDVARWRDRLAGLAGLRVGVCWAGGRSNRLEQILQDRLRSLALASLAPLADISGVRFISLQKGPPAAQAVCPPHGMALHDFTDELHDFADTAALIENLDLVITVCTSVVHLAGALGKPVWLLNNFSACFRWLQNREDSPWYPSLRQFRQPAPGDWNTVIRDVRRALQRLAAGDRSQLRPPLAVNQHPNGHHTRTTTTP